MHLLPLAFFHLTAMHSSGNIVPEILGTRSNSVVNIRNEYTHVPRWFHKIVFRVPRSVPRSQCSGNMASKLMLAAFTIFS
jgi:hypothetical protein